uniref:Carbohydrate sulfotransferase n=1 Tax=Glossina pallidipes TaxID=7398 RepID=A0A1B0A3N3_GLOPL
MDENTLNDLLECSYWNVWIHLQNDPFERIVSGYRNKLEDCKNNYYKSLAKRIIKRFQFNIIGKLETFARDSEFIIREAGLEYLLLDKLSKNKLSRMGNLAKGEFVKIGVHQY